MSPKCSTWVQSQKWQTDLCSFSWQTIQHHSFAEENEVERFYEDLHDLLELTPKKRCSFHHRGLECKSRKSRNTWSNRQIWPWNTEWSKAKANRVLPRKRTSHSKHPLPTTQEKTLHMDITRWSTPKSDWLNSLQPKMEKLYTVSKNKTRNNNPVYETAKETLMYRTVFWTLWERERVGWFGRMALKHV